ncbi:hypothetical protein BTRA_5250 [Burkholderia thailandensis USAMRU Malaysia |uniref:Uncharacterized protein n=1 Tax=Burkholderia thailandensis (strain ATCC 700388 / DSM 13276 / CCUG 48851 / CIP 106301 / E264) TaxID=271848 RepID=Q2T8V2_BURTA|nr:hypothetical protein [Burkholderia thailandensis]ABC35141.1 conserved hypothetical protein [Burkholderia thailandensis E264]AHI75698.1 hypothetical protein BTQ_3487 [Burkholderia thailandensis 2002721723]AHI81130.1 hypothetical protein BTJ_4524 [Burkholderia thailandensis E444]AIC90070.1 hypothetical protein BTRA_5250 [Burkholderia thailandensis USAMRU Malaysia \
MELNTTMPAGGARAALQAGLRDGIRTPAAMQPENRDGRVRNAARGAAQMPAVGRGAADRGDVLAVHQRVNEQASGMQLVLDYLEQFGDRMKALKQALSVRLAGGGSDLDVRAKIDGAAAAWNRRAAATGGRLSDALELGGANSARRAFVLRGLDVQDARRAEGEVITFHLGGTGARPATLYLAPDLSAREMAYQLKVALAPLGIDCETHARERITFSVEESRWPVVARGLHVKGGGVRFPAGAPQRAAMADVPGRIDASDWEAGDVGAMRAALTRAVQTVKRIDQVSVLAEHALKRARQTLASMPSELGAQRAQDACERIAADASARGGYGQVAVLSAVTAGLDRARVRALLSMR